MSGFLDAAAGLPLHPAARAALLAALEDGWADPGKLYAAGRRARQLLDGAREAVAVGIGARPDEVSFVASGTAAVHLGVLGAHAARRRTGAQVVHSAIEHSSVLAALAPSPTTTVPVDRTGRVDADAFAAALRPDTALACLISASHEVGTVQPVEPVAQACAAAGVPLLVDAAQSVGRTALPHGWSLLAASAHKWGGPSGVGVLAVRTGVRWRAPLPGLEREVGTLPLPQVLAAAVALQAATAEAAAEDARLRPLVDRMRARIGQLPDVSVVGDPHDRLPHLLALSFPYADGEVLQRALDREGLAVSSGSSCAVTVLEPSHVLEAMGLLTSAHVRVSLHRGTTEDDVERFLAVLPRVLAEQRT
jgi:cysteine desulfurase